MNETDFLVARPSFFEGIARVMDLGNTLSVYNTSSTTSAADERALRNDFRMVGQDIMAAAKILTNESSKK